MLGGITFWSFKGVGLFNARLQAGRLSLRGPGRLIGLMFGGNHLLRDPIALHLALLLNLLLLHLLGAFSFALKLLSFFVRGALLQNSRLALLLLLVVIFFRALSLLAMLRLLVYLALLLLVLSGLFTLHGHVSWLIPVGLCD